LNSRKPFTSEYYMANYNTPFSYNKYPRGI